MPALRAAAMDRKQSKEVQEAIIAALGKLGKNGVDVLIATLKDKDREVDVRRRAIESLGELGPDARSAVATLVEALQGGSPGGKKKEMAPGDLRMEICGALGLIANSKDDAAIKALGMIAGEKKGKNKALKSAANDALKKVKNRN